MTVQVTGHALAQYQQRLRFTGTDEEARDLIRTDVREALEAGRIRDRKLPDFRLYGEKQKKNDLPPGQRFVWREDRGVAWIIVEEGGVTVVITTLTPVSSNLRGPVTP